MGALAGPLPATRRTRAAGTSAPRRPKPAAKATRAADCLELEQLPNIGPSLAADLRLLGIPSSWSGEIPGSFTRRCAVTGQRQDPCVLDTFMAITCFMAGEPARPWWAYTAARKAQYGVL
jgi:hypothetical protein